MSDYPCNAPRRPRAVSVDELPGRVSTDYAEIHYEKGTFAPGTTLTIQPRDGVHGIDVLINVAPPKGKSVTVYLNPSTCGAAGEFKFRIRNGKKPVQVAVINEERWVHARLKLEDIIDANGGEMGIQRVSGFVILSN